VTIGPSPLQARPRVMPSQTGRISTALGTAFVTLTRDPDGQPFEVFLNVGKAGSETFASAEALGRLISLSLRLSSPISRSERVREIADQLEHIGSQSNDASLLSIPDALAKVLREFLAEKAVDERFKPSISEAASVEQLRPPPSKVVSDEPSQLPAPRSDLPVTKPLEI
jgi:ribonucleoside-diphosphate reductase alpha chain